VGVANSIQYQYKWKVDQQNYTIKQQKKVEQFKETGNIAWFSGNDKTSRYDVSWHGPTNRHCFFGASLGSVLRNKVYVCGKAIEPDAPGYVLGACKRGDNEPFIGVYATNSRIDFWRWEIQQYTSKKQWLKTGEIILPQDHFVSNTVFFSQDATKGVTYCVQKKLFKASLFGLGWIRDYEYYIPHRIEFTISEACAISWQKIDLSGNHDLDLAYVYDPFTARFSYIGPIASEYIENTLTHFSINEQHFIHQYDELGFLVSPRIIGLPPPNGGDRDIELIEGIDVFDAECKHALTGIPCWYYGFEEHPPVEYQPHDGTESAWLEMKGQFSTSQQTIEFTIETPNGFRGSWDDNIFVIGYSSPFSGLEPWWVHWATVKVNYPGKQRAIVTLPDTEEFVGQHKYYSSHRINVPLSYIRVNMFLDQIPSVYWCSGHYYEPGPGYGTTAGGILNEGTYTGSFSSDTISGGVQSDNFIPYTGDRNKRTLILVIDIQAGVFVIAQSNTLKTYARNNGAWQLNSTATLTNPIAANGVWVGWYTSNGYTNYSHDLTGTFNVGSVGIWGTVGEYASDKFGNYMYNIEGSKKLSNSTETLNWAGIGVI